MAKSTGLTGRIKDANAWISVGARLWQVAKFLGIDGWIAAAFWGLSALLLAGAIYVIDAAPWYAILIAAVMFSTALLHFWNKLCVAWSLRGVKTFDIEQFAEDCIAYYREFSDFMVSRQEARPKRAMGISRNEIDRAWQEGVDFSQRTDALILQRFAPRAFAIAHQMKSLGIRPPNMFHFTTGDHGGVGPYIGIVGELLRKGLLDEARKLDPQVTWGASFR